MRKVSRMMPPPLLAQNWEQWGIKWEHQKNQNPKAQFKWKILPNNLAIRDLILEYLDYMTCNHCAFCDGSPIGTESRSTVEHFRPKSNPLFYKLVYQWENLFLCCDVCQSAKGEKFDEKLLKPDDESYEFNKFFFVDSEDDYMIKPNPKASKEEQERAEITSRIYKFNTKERKINRRIRFNDGLRKLKNGYVIDDLPYRYLFE